MVTIHKTYLHSGIPVQSLPMPRHSEIFKLGVQYNIPTIWYICDTELPLEDRTFRTLLTGEEITEDMDDGDYIGTYLIDNDSFVGHVFEIL